MSESPGVSICVSFHRKSWIGGMEKSEYEIGSWLNTNKPDNRLDSLRSSNCFASRTCTQRAGESIMYCTYGILPEEGRKTADSIRQKPKKPQNGPFQIAHLNIKTFRIPLHKNTMHTPRNRLSNSPIRKSAILVSHLPALLQRQRPIILQPFN